MNQRDELLMIISDGLVNNPEGDVKRKLDGQHALNDLVAWNRLAAGTLTKLQEAWEADDFDAILTIIERSQVLLE